MKKLSLFALVLLVSASCKKEYAKFSNSDTQHFYAQKTTAPVLVENSILEAESLILNEITPEIREEVLSASLTAAPETISSLATSAPIEEAIAPLKVTKVSSTKKTKVKIKDLLKVKKELKQLKKNGSKENKAADTLALISLILGGLGLVALFFVPGLPLLFGIAALVTGIISLKRNSSNRGMAILGTVFGGIITVIGVIAILAVAAFLATA